MSADIAVVYICRGEGGGVPAAQRFLQSYRNHPAGCAHKLVAIMKGWESDPTGRAEADAIFRAEGAEMLALPDDGFDLGAYFRAAEKVDAELMCLLNTHSEILSADWLRNLTDAVTTSDIGAAGATGSFGSMAPTLSLYPPMLRRMRARLPLPIFLLRAIASVLLFFPIKRLIWRDWPSFPNANLRTNGLILRRDLLKVFGDEVGLPLTKQDAWAIESGRSSLTRWLERRGLGSVVVDKDGRAHSAESWLDCGVFRTPGQPNLMIADNQTRRYDSAEIDEKQVMEISAWGRILSR